MKVFREVKREHRPGRGRWWCPKGAGYTSVIANAGLYDRERHVGMEDATWSQIPAVPLLEAEIVRLREQLAAVEKLLKEAR